MSFLKFTKDGSTKLLKEESKLIPILKAEGWKAEGDSDLDALRAEAEALGLKPHHKAGEEKLREMIEEAKK